MTYKNANIKSKKELAQRLLNGEVFYAENGCKIQFDENACYPFRYESEPLKPMWSCYADMQIKTDWRDTVSPENPVLCWVSDDEESERDFASKITIYEKDDMYPYTRQGKCRWKYATPVTINDIYKDE